MVTTENKQPVLSESEIKLIELNRQKEETAKKEAEIKKAIEREKSIEAKKKEIATFLAKNIEEENNYRSFLAQLNAVDNRFVLEVKDVLKEFKCTDYTYVSDPEREGRTKSVEDIFFTETVPYKAFAIKHTVSGDEIEVKEHYSSGGKHSYRQVNNGYKMFFKYDRKPYKVAKTVADIIIADIAKAERQNKAANDKKTAKEQAYNFLTKEYPEAKVEEDSKYHARYRNGRHENGYTTELYAVKFANGMTFRFSYDLLEAGKLRVSFFDMEGVKDANVAQVIKALKNI